MARNEKHGSITFGVVLVTIGLLLLLDQMGILDFGRFISTFWPVILIVIGLRIILFPRARRSGGDNAGFIVATPGGEELSTGADDLNVSRLFGDVKKRLVDPSLSGGRCSVTFGDIDIDATGTRLAEGQRTLYLNSIFGDIRLVLPADVPVLVRANTTAGDIDIKGVRGEGLFVQRSFKSDDFDGADTRLIVVASVLFGDVRIWDRLP